MTKSPSDHPPPHVDKCRTFLKELIFLFYQKKGGKIFRMNCSKLEGECDCYIDALNNNNTRLIKPPTQYRPGTCGFCLIGDTCSLMKTCTGCQMVSYCSVEHQRSHWKSHKTFCNFVKKRGGPSKIYQPDVVMAMTRTEFIAYQMDVFDMFIQHSQRPFTLVEMSLFYSPRVCRITGCYSPISETGRMLECEECRCVVWCSKEHKEEGQEQHQVYCRDLKLSEEFHRIECYKGVNFPNSKAWIAQEYEGDRADDIKRHVRKMMGVDNGIKLSLEDELVFANLTNHYTGPRTLLKYGHR